MALIPVNADKLLQTGRVQANNPNLPEVFYTYNANFSSAAEYEINFATLNTEKQFGVVESLFIDNGSNPSDVEISVSGTDQYFTVPPFAQGFFNISANAQSRIRLYSAGGASDIVTTSFYNRRQPPQVWYSYGPTNIAEPQKVYGPMSPGVAVSAQNTNTPIYIGAVDGTGVFRAVKCDNTGKLEMAGTISISSIVIADGNDVAMGSTTSATITNPATNGTLISYTRGLLTDSNSLVAGVGAPTDAAVLAAGNGSAIAQLKGISSNLGASSNPAITNPATDGSLISFTRGVLTGVNTTNTNTGAPTDAAVTNPAASASIIAALKGILTGINSLFSWRTAATGTQSSVAAATVDTAILASNANRKGAAIYNDSTATMYLLVGSGAASTTAYTVQVIGGAYYEVPYGYTGPIRAVWASATGNARVTEYS